jgi:hypothetical protein
MEDDLKSKEQLMRELGELRQRIAFYEESKAENEKLRSALLNSSESYRSILEASPS